MGFWIFMFLMTLWMPLTMIGFGRYFQKKAPKEINAAFGYRTKSSMKNRDTWTFAHNYFGKLWHICGIILLLPSILVMLFVIGKSEDTVGTAGGILCVIQMIFLVGPIWPTERALKYMFDKNGNRKQEE